VTATDQDEAADRFARHIDLLLTPYVPDVSRWGLARRIVADARAEHWKCIPPPKPVALAREPGTPPTDEFKAIKAALRKDPTDD
jgi:hypothetical protein